MSFDVLKLKLQIRQQIPRILFLFVLVGSARADDLKALGVLVDSSSSPSNAIVVQAKNRKGLFDFIQGVPLTRIYTSEGRKIYSRMGLEKSHQEEIKEVLGNTSTERNPLSFEMKGLDILPSDRHLIRDLQVDFVLVQYWATWCSFCSEHTAQLNSIVSQEAEKEFLWIQAEK